MQIKVVGILFLLYICTSCTLSLSDSEDSSYKEIKRELEDIRKDDTDKNSTEKCKRLEKIISNFPQTVPQPDSLIHYARQALYLYSMNLITSHLYKDGSEFLESTSSPFIIKYCLYDRTAILAHLYQLGGENEKAMFMTKEFTRLPDPVEKERLIKYSEMIGCAYYYCGHDLQQAILILEKAHKAYLEGGTFTGMPRLLSRLGTYYKMAGRYEDALRTNHEAIELFEQQKSKSHYLVMIYGEQSNLYLTLSMHDNALKYNDIACRYSKENNNYALGDLLRFRAQIYDGLNHIDSVFYFLHQAVDASKKLKSFKGVYYNNLELAEAYSQLPDSAHKADVLIEQMCADSTQVPMFLKEQLNVLIGKIMLNKGKTTEGIRRIENAIQNLQKAGMAENVNQTIKMLMDAYLNIGMNNKFAEYYQLYQSINDSLIRDERAKALIASNIRFSTRQTEQQNKQLSTELKLKDKNIQIYTFGSIALVFISLSIGIWLWMRQRTYCLQLKLEEQERIATNMCLQEQEEKLKQLITSRQKLNNHNEELLRQLAEIQASNEQTCNLDQVMEKLQPRLLTLEEEHQFRNSFSTLYPTALHNLRTHCPKITRTEELLCMLIVLKQTNEEIAHTMGINRPSVVQTRYRLRIKLALSEGSNLDEEIRSILMK